MVDLRSSVACHRHRLVVAALLLAGCGPTAETSATSPELGVVVPDAPLGAIAGRPAGPQSAEVAWKRTLEGAVVPGPVEGPDGTVYAASNGGVLHALDPATGENRWTFDGGAAYGVDLSTSPVVSGGAILWPGPGDTVFALDARTGALRERAEVPGQPTTPARRSVATGPSTPQRTTT